MQLYPGWKDIYPGEDKKCSKYIHCGVPQGVPQGSCLGPLLYSIFTNDLPSVMNKTREVMYADDSTMYSAASECNELTDVLSRERRMVSEWVDMNKLVFLKLNVLYLVQGICLLMTPN
jgi:hypothetical protein